MNRRGRLLRAFGPGILLAGTAIGAGDLLTASLAGSEAGYAVLWAVPFGVAIKWCLSEGIARWQMATGKTLLEGWVLHLGRWVQWLFLPYLLLFAFVVGGALTNACGVAGSALLPIGTPEQSKAIWGVTHSFAALILILRGGFGIFQAAVTACVAMMFASALLTVALVPPDWGAAARGLLPSAEEGALRWSLALLGGIGGTMTLLSYGYWIREEGRMGREGLSLCRRDLTTSYIGTGVFGAAVVIIGSRLELQGQGIDLARTMAAQLAERAGPAGGWFFLLAFWGTVFSSMLGVWQSLPWIFVNFVGLRRGESGAAVQAVPPRSYRIFLVLLATVPLVLLAAPVRTIQFIFGVFGALFLPLLTLTLLLLNNRTLPPGFRNGWVSNGVLALALAFFAWMGIEEILELRN